MLEKAAKNTLKHFKSLLKDAAKSDWEDAVKEVTDSAKKHSEAAL